MPGEEKASPETSSTRGTIGGKPNDAERGLVPQVATSTTATSSTAESGTPPKPGVGGYKGTCDKDQCGQIVAALNRARELVRRARQDISPGFGRDGGPEKLRPETASAFEWHFRTLDPASIGHVDQLFGHIEERLKSGLSLFSCADLDNACGVGGDIAAAIPIVGAPLNKLPVNVAYTHEGDSPIVLCPIFFSRSLDDQAATILHEAGHNVGLSIPATGPDAYINSGRYRALSAEEALATTDAYAHFALDNVQGIPGRVAMASQIGEVRAGVALSDKEPPQLVLSWGNTFEYTHPVLRILVPTAGFEVIYMPFTGQQDQRVILAGTVGARLAERGEKIFLDLRTGVTVGNISDGLKSVLVEASGHIQAGDFNISAFFQAHKSLLEGEQGKIIIGVGGSWK